MPHITRADTDTCHDIAELGLLLYALLADPGHSKSVMIRAVGKAWKLTVEQLEDTEG